GLREIEPVRRRQADLLAECRCAVRVDDTLEQALVVDSGDAERRLDTAVLRERIAAEQRKLADLLGDDQPRVDVGGHRLAADVDGLAREKRRAAEVRDPRELSAPLEAPRLVQIRDLGGERVLEVERTGDGRAPRRRDDLMAVQRVAEI